MAVADFLAPIGGLGGAGLALRWMFARIDRYQVRIEQRLRDVEADNDACHKRFNLVLGVFYPVLGALRRHEPSSPELRQAEIVLNRAFAMDPSIPKDMQSALDQLDKVA